jgi:hypothetical protein
MRTEVSSRPRAGLTGSGTWQDPLVEHPIDVRAEGCGIDGGSTCKCLQRGGGWYELPSTERAQLSDGCAVARDYERFAAVELAHDLAAVIAQLTLCDLSRHGGEM